MRDVISRAPFLALAALAAWLLHADGLAGQESAPGAPAERGWIGISFVVEDGEPVIKNVFEGSPAARADLRAGDVLLEIGGEDAGREGLVRFARRVRPGQEVELRVRRNGSVRDVELVAGSRPRTARAPVPPEVMARLDSVREALVRRFDSIRAGMRPVPSSPPLPAVGGPPPAAVPDSVRVRLRGLQEELLRVQRAQRELAARIRGSAGEVGEEELLRRRALRQRAESVERQLHELYGSIAADAARSSADAVDRARRLERMREERMRRGEIEVAPRPTPHLLGRSYVAGARMTELNPGLAEYFGVDRGVLLTDVLADSPAQEAGLQAGDVIVSADGHPISSLGALRRVLAGVDDWPVTLEIVRKGEERSLRLRR